MISILWFFLIHISFASCAWSADLGLINPESLNNAINDWVILDGRPKTVWEKQHIPGALSFSWEDYTQTDDKKIPYRVLPPEKLSMALGRMGIDENTPVVACGDADSSWGGEGWICWALAWIGHKGPICLLSGGIQKWEALGYPMEQGAATSNRPEKRYAVAAQPFENISAQGIRNLKQDTAIVDTRSTREWLLEDHLPGAVHVNWKKYVSGPYNEVLDAPAFSKLMADYGIPEDKPVVYYCTGGVRSAFAWMVHQIRSKSAAMNFEGGMEEWKRDKE